MLVRATGGGGGVPALLWLVVGAMVAIELLLAVGDRGWLGGIEWRRTALVYGAFWQPLVAGTARPAFDGQTATMFLTHAFLHGGLAHLALNTVILLALGKFVAEQAGPWPMLLLFLVCAVAGGAGFSLLADARGPMIGASGAMFGFIGLWQYWETLARRRHGMTLRPVVTMLLGLAAINVVLAVVLDGGLAWEAHLGGFLGGVAAGPLMTLLARRRLTRTGRTAPYAAPPP